MPALNRNYFKKTINIYNFKCQINIFPLQFFILHNSAVPLMKRCKTNTLKIILLLVNILPLRESKKEFNDWLMTERKAGLMTVFEQNNQYLCK